MIFHSNKPYPSVAVVMHFLSVANIVSALFNVGA